MATIIYVDASNGVTLYTDNDADRSDLAIGCRVHFVTDKRFGRKIEITGQIVSITLQVTDIADEPASRLYVVALRTD